MNLTWVISGLIIAVVGFAYVFPVEVTSQIGNTFTVSLFASFLKLNMQPNPIGWGVLAMGFVISLMGLFQEKEMKSYKLSCGCVLKTNDPEGATQKCVHGNKFNGV